MVCGNFDNLPVSPYFVHNHVGLGGEPRELGYPVMPSLHQGHLFALRLTNAVEPASIRTPVAWEAIEYGRS
jgi:hypothetical protein